jgi:hypothetical protein
MIFWKYVKKVVLTEKTAAERRMGKLLLEK